MKASKASYVIYTYVLGGGLEKPQIDPYGGALT